MVPDDQRVVLFMVAELHARGYQRLRITPAMAPSGCWWRCDVAPASNISTSNGARLADSNGLVARHSSGFETHYFRMDDVSGDLTPAELASKFAEHFPEIAEAGYGSDEPYAAWYREMLTLTHPDHLPIVELDWESGAEELRTIGPGPERSIPLPPPGDCEPVRNF